MRTRVTAIAACCLLALTAIAEDAVHTFGDALTKHQLYLRNFSADPRVRGHWDAVSNSLVMEAPTIHSLTAFTATSVNVKDAVVEIKGATQTLVRDTATHIALSSHKSDIVIQLDLRGADIDAILPRLPGLLFYPGQDEALTEIPKAYQNVLPMKANDTCCGEPVKIKPQAIDCDCADLSSDSCTTNGTGVPKGIAPPRVIYAVDPEFSEKERKYKLNATIQIGLTVDTGGRPREIWVTRGTGTGLDAKAGEAVSQYRFAPATCGGTPTAITLYIDVNFQVY